MRPGVHSFKGKSSRQFLCLLTGNAECEVSVHNANITKWRVAGDDLLYLSEKSKWADNEEIRGGVPLCWPQFAGDGPWGHHGFVRMTTEWKILEQSEGDGSPSVTLVLTDCEDSRKTGFAQKFKMLYKITLGERSLRTSMTLHNLDEQPMKHNGAFHGYWRIKDPARMRLEGVEGATYYDKPTGKTEKQEGALTVTGMEIDRIFKNAPDTVRLCYAGSDGKYVLSIARENLPHLVVWNIGKEGIAKFDDMKPDDWKNYICVEPGHTGDLMELLPGKTWSVTQAVTVSRMESEED
eukprot:Polyplicarium_translucidae@DN2674_c1_g1_i1.p1